MRCKLAEYMLAQLEQDDGEDLYFEGGRKGGEFLDALGRGVISRRFLEDMLDITTSSERSRGDVDRGHETGVQGTRGRPSGRGGGTRGTG